MEVTEVKEEVISDEEDSGGQSAKSKEYIEYEEKILKIEPKVEAKVEPIGAKSKEYIEYEEKILKLEPKVEPKVEPYDEEFEMRNLRYQKIHSDCKKRKIEQNSASSTISVPQNAKRLVNTYMIIWKYT